MMIIRSLLFNALFLTWTFVVSLLSMPLLLGRGRWVRFTAMIWSGGIVLLARMVIGLRYEVRGRENLPPGPCIIASKHQSAWETFAYHVLLPEPVYVLKRELFFIPMAGWLMWKAGMIGIDRKKGLQALKILIRGAGEALALGKQIVIFPEGTRTAPGTSRPYQPGVAMLYQNLDADVVPVALNSGLFWGRRSFMKKPGVIVVEFLPPLPCGMSKRDFMATLSQRIEDASTRLLEEAEGTAPAPNGKAT